MSPQNAESSPPTKLPPRKPSKNPITTTNNSSDTNHKRAMEKFGALVMEVANSSSSSPLSVAQKTLIQDRLSSFFSDFRTPDHPPYAAMIHSAITELKERGGSSEESISEFMKEYHDLPWAHFTFLKHHLEKLCDSGEIVATRGQCYILAGANPMNSSSTVPKREHLKRKRRSKMKQGLGRWLKKDGTEDEDKQRKERLEAIGQQNQCNTEHKEVIEKQNEPSEEKVDAAKEQNHLFGIADQMVEEESDDQQYKVTEKIHKQRSNTAEGQSKSKKQEGGIGAEQEQRNWLQNKAKGSWFAVIDGQPEGRQHKKDGTEGEDKQRKEQLDAIDQQNQFNNEHNVVIEKQNQPSEEKGDAVEEQNHLFKVANQMIEEESDDQQSKMIAISHKQRSNTAEGQSKSKKQEGGTGAEQEQQNPVTQVQNKAKGFCFQVIDEHPEGSQLRLSSPERPPGFNFVSLEELSQLEEQRIMASVHKTRSLLPSVRPLLDVSIDSVQLDQELNLEVPNSRRPLDHDPSVSGKFSLKHKQQVEPSGDHDPLQKQEPPSKTSLNPIAQPTDSQKLEQWMESDASHLGRHAEVRHIVVDRFHSEECHGAVCNGQKVAICEAEKISVPVDVPASLDLLIRDQQTGLQNPEEPHVVKLTSVEESRIALQQIKEKQQQQSHLELQRRVHLHKSKPSTAMLNLFSLLHQPQQSDLSNSGGLQEVKSTKMEDSLEVKEQRFKKDAIYGRRRKPLVTHDVSSNLQQIRQEKLPDFANPEFSLGLKPQKNESLLQGEEQGAEAYGEKVTLNSKVEIKISPLGSHEDDDQLFQEEILDISVAKRHLELETGSTETSAQTERHRRQMKRWSKRSEQIDSYPLQPEYPFRDSLQELKKAPIKGSTQITDQCTKLRSWKRQEITQQKTVIASLCSPFDSQHLVTEKLLDLLSSERSPEVEPLKEISPQLKAQEDPLHRALKSGHATAACAGEGFPSQHQHEQQQPEEQPKHKGRGRPRGRKLVASVSVEISSNSADDSQNEPKGVEKPKYQRRGRPPKLKLVAETTDESLSKIQHQQEEQPNRRDCGRTLPTKFEASTTEDVLHNSLHGPQQEPQWQQEKQLKHQGCGRPPKGNLEAEREEEILSSYSHILHQESQQQLQEEPKSTGCERPPKGKTSNREAVAVTQETISRGDSESVGRS